MKKFIAILLSIITILSFTLFGCNKSFEGTYSFRMGKYDDKYFEISLQLTEDDYIYEGTNYGKKFTLNVDFANMFIGEDDGGLAMQIATFFQNGLSIPGYYNAGETSDKGTKLDFGLSVDKLLGDIDAVYGELIKLVLGSTLTEYFASTGIELDGDILEYIILAYANGEVVDMIIPVSVEDLLFQLYWYGIDINRETLDFVKVDAHEIGTHPTKEQVELVNQTYPATHFEKVDTGELDEYDQPITYDKEIYYRDFHTINLELLKK